MQKFKITRKGFGTSLNREVNCGTIKVYLNPIHMKINLFEDIHAMMDMKREKIKNIMENIIKILKREGYEIRIR